ncbi:MAG: ABC-F family ATP-binding cassette domain-containing protein [Lachnospiraceae bacterium]|nr:ABC-F family ATP-binding cassette domain-containing protein [Lachnospiraceae bacterium]
MLLSCQNICKAFVEKIIIQNVSFHIEDNDKAAIIGINGAGKTTLLKIIVGELSPDNGQVIFGKDKTLGYLKQNQSVTSENTIYDELLAVKADLINLEKQIRETEIKMKDNTGETLEQLLAVYTRLTHDFEFAGGYAYRSEVVGVLKGLGFCEDDFPKFISTLSGGQKTRVALGKLLLTKPDLIILDEPTNHLDIIAVSWLETYLQNYKGAVIIVSHDRYFLDRIANKVIEVSNTKAALFNGNYTTYAAKKEKLRADEMKAYLNQQQEIGRQEAVITKLRQFNREKHIKRAKSREKQLEKVELIAKPETEVSEIRLQLKPAVESGKDVLEIAGLKKSFGNLHLFSDVNFNIRRGEHVAIIGDNGTGKTTLLKILNKYLEADAGRFSFVTNVHPGYYDQELLFAANAAHSNNNAHKSQKERFGACTNVTHRRNQLLDETKTLMMEISDAYPQMSDTEIRNMLAAFLFTGDDVFKRVKDLSGGERGRLSLAKLMLSQANFLLLDEPTNHLDIISKEILEEALNCYTGTVLFVSHDRYFINRTATRILELTANGFVDYPGYDTNIGTYDYYLEKKEKLKNAAAFDEADSVVPLAGISEAKADYIARKEKQAAGRKRENDIRRLEEKISILENELQNLENQMLAPELVTNAEGLMRLSDEKTGLEDELSGLYDEWEKLN